MNELQRQWGLPQWVEYLREKPLPVLPETRSAVLALDAQGGAGGEGLAARTLAGIVFADPYLALTLLRQAEAGRSQQLGHETTTPLAAVLQTGYDELRARVLESEDSAAELPGHRRCEQRSVTASAIARAWSAHRHDVSPDEVAMAALLADIGELLLWRYAPEMAATEAEVRDWNDRFSAFVPRSTTMIFDFRQLTVALAQAWGLPGLVIQLIRGLDNVRANLARLASDMAKRRVDQAAPAAMLPLLMTVRDLIPAASPAALVMPLGLDPDTVATMVAALRADEAGGTV